MALERRPGPRRRMAAFMFTDMVGYSALTARDEMLSFELLEEHRGLLRRFLPQHGGQEIKTTGDGFFIEFGSAVDAVQCAIEIQSAFHERNLVSSSDRRIEIRVGLHVGDILHTEGDSYGDSVNIAARVEALAEAGGICLTQQVADHAARQLGLKLSRLRNVHLKNLGAPTAVYRVKLPWSRRERAFKAALPRLRDLSLQAALPWLWGAAILGVAALCASHLSRPPLPSPGRSPASAAPKGESARIRLDQAEWWIAPDPFGLAPEQAGRDARLRWKRFDPWHQWELADELRGRYWLRTRFASVAGLERPAIVLGIVSDVYRAYVNGAFVGGSDNFSSVEVLPFDRRLADRPLNELLIAAETVGSLNPGLSVLPEVGSFVGEFEEAFGSVLAYRLRFHVLGSVYLAVGLAFAAVCLACFAFDRRRLRYLHAGLYLLLSCLTLVYYNALVSTAMGYQAHRFIKVTSLGLSSAVLLAGWLDLRGRERRSRAAHAAGLALWAACAVWLLGREIPPTAFVEHYNIALRICCFLALAWVAPATVVSARSAFSGKGSGIRPKAEEWVWIAFGWGTLAFSASAIKGGWFATLGWSGPFGRLSVLAPFVFALLVAAAGVTEYLRKKRAAARGEVQQRLFLSLHALMEEAPDLGRAMGEALGRVSSAVDAQGSVMYLRSPGGALEIRHRHGRSESLAAFAPSLQLGQGIVGIASETGAPVLVRDVATDPRYARVASQARGSFMVFPMTYRGKLLGAVAFAREGRAFARSDFALMHGAFRGLVPFLALAPRDEVAA